MNDETRSGEQPQEPGEESAPKPDAGLYEFIDTLEDFTRRIRFSAPGSEPLRVRLIEMYNEKKPAPPNEGQFILTGTIFGVAFQVDGTLSRTELVSAVEVSRILRAICDRFTKAVDDFARERRAVIGSKPH